MYVHEYQAKKILRNFGLNTPKGMVVSSKKATASALKKVKAFPIIIKAQVHAGGRKKSGGIQTANSLADARKKINDMIGTKIINEQTGKEGKIIKKVYLEEVVAIKQEYYLSLVVDRAAAQLTFIASAAGGIAIEEVAQQNPEKIIKVPVNVATDLQDFHVRKIFFALHLSAEQFPELHKVMHGIYNAFISTDASQIEINPLVLDTTNKLIALDAKINFDDNALYRQKAIAKLADKSEKTHEEKIAAQCKLNFIQMHGNIGCMVNGAGLAMATMDLIKQYGGNPANFLDVGGEATVQTVSKALEIICKQKAVKTILVNIFGGIVKADIIADGIIDMLPKLKNPPSIVIRLLGTNAELAKAKLAKTPYKIFFTDNIEEAAREAVKYSTTVSSTCRF